MKRGTISKLLFWLLVVWLLAIVPILAACEYAITETMPTTTLPQPGPLEVFITDHGFVPATITVPLGEYGSTVTWINKDITWRAVGERPPTGESVDARPYGESGRLEPGETYSRNFLLPGAWKYHCPKTEQRGEVILIAEME